MSENTSHSARLCIHSQTIAPQRETGNSTTITDDPANTKAVEIRTMKKIVAVVVLICWHCHCAVSLDSGSGSSSNTSRILRNLQKYANPRLRPNEGTGSPEYVNVSMYVQHLRISSETDRFLAMDVYMRRKWNDPRLKYTYGPDKIVLHQADVERLVWVPDLFISNAIDVSLHEGVRPTYGFVLSPNGNVLCSSRLSLKTNCEMDLRNFPMDTQICELRLESYMHSSDDIELSWDSERESVSVGSVATKPPAFVLLKVDHRTSVLYLSGNRSFHNLRVSFHLKRLSSHYIVMTYIPCVFVVALSCLIFWMPVTSLAERAFYGAFLFLSTVMLVIGSQYGTPQVGYLKAIDIWGICCLAFVFCAVLEVMVLHLLRRGATDNHDKMDQFELMKEDELGKLDQQPHLASSRTINPNVLRRVDIAFRVIYPATFVLFNAIYWATYTN